MPFWLLKSDPEAYSWEDMVREYQTCWDGVRNYQARNNLRRMKVGDEALFYHSVTEKQVVGVVRVVREAYQDPTTEDERWSAIDVQVVEALGKAVPLGTIKGDRRLQGIALVKQSRLSVCPLTKPEFQLILQLARKGTAEYA